MKNIITILEGIFGDVDKDINKGAGKYAEEWIRDTLKSSCKVMILKDGSIKIRGDLKVTNVPDWNVYVNNIKELNGNIVFEKVSGFKSLEQVFQPYARVNGGITIVDCPDFDSLEGCPSANLLEVSGCKQLKSLEGISSYIDIVTIFNCGKKFKKDQIKKYTLYAKSINCEEEPEEANIVEAFKDPVLSNCVTQYKAAWYAKQKNSYWEEDRKKKFSQRDFDNLFRWDWMMSEVTPANRITIDIDRDDEKDWTKIASKMFRNTDDQIAGFIIGYDSFEDKYIFVAKSDGKGWEMTRIQKVDTWNYSASDIKSLFSKKHLMSMGVNILYIYQESYLRVSRSDDDFDMRWKKRNARDKAREGMVSLDQDSMKEYARAQQRRYKKAAEQIRATKSSSKYKEYETAINKLMDRTNAMMKKMIEDTKWCATKRWEIQHALDAMFRKPEYGKSYNYSGGALYYFQNLAVSVARLQEEKDSYVDQSTVDDYLSRFIEACAKADKELAAVGF